MTGNNIPAGVVAKPEVSLSDAELREMKQGAEAYIDDFMRENGILEPGLMTEPDGRRRLRVGPSEATAFIAAKDGEMYLHGEAVVMELPSDKELILPLMRELLDMNVTVPGCVRLGLRGHKVVASCLESLVVLEPKDIRRHLQKLLAVVDSVGGQLSVKYSGTTRERQPSR